MITAVDIPNFNRENVGFIVDEYDEKSNDAIEQIEILVESRNSCF